MRKYLYAALICVLLACMGALVLVAIKTTAEVNAAVDDYRAAKAEATDRAEKACDQARQEVKDGKATMTQLLATRCRP
ncbi:hypothetical protein [Magnetospirillum sp. 15-1]|uniref:hypothetical protein n=1 Tax=Magnetospirillum sp. 15-1 TaxID=1979370 RepID=UPI000BBC374C|nr:hypothetical protein [Magnetospirillum sp. 15-1]